VRATTGEARDRAANAARAGKVAPAIRTLVKKAADSFGDCKRKIMATLFVTDSKIDTRGAPFFAVRRNSSASSAKLREEMRELVKKCALDLVRMIVQSRIERDQFVTEVGATGAAF
jgi:hypothetical protein